MLVSRLKSPAQYWTRILWNVSMSEGRPDPYHVQHVWQSMVNRHPMLGTIFVKTTAGFSLFEQITLRESNAATSVLKKQISYQAGLDALMALLPPVYGNDRSLHRPVISQPPEREML